MQQVGGVAPGVVLPLAPCAASEPSPGSQRTGIHVSSQERQSSVYQSEALEHYPLTFSKVPSRTWQWPKYSETNKGTWMKKKKAHNTPRFHSPSPGPTVWQHEPSGCHGEGQVTSPSRTLVAREAWEKKCVGMWELPDTHGGRCAVLRPQSLPGLHATYGHVCSPRRQEAPIPSPSSTTAWTTNG